MRELADYRGIACSAHQLKGVLKASRIMYDQTTVPEMHVLIVQLYFCERRKSHFIFYKLCATEE